MPATRRPPRPLTLATLLLAVAAITFTLWWTTRTTTAAPTPDQRLLALDYDLRRDVKPDDLAHLVGPLGLDVVRNTDRVEFFKLDIDAYGTDPWAIHSKVDGTPAQLAHARDVLLTPDLYSYNQRGGHKKCGGFQPRDVVRFWRGNASTAFMICFSCSDAAVITHDATGQAHPYIIADTKPGKARLRDLVHTVFPNTVRDPY